ncbi:MAG TPA: ABC transporter permease, partial [Gemmataceae bacterium]|nr:ABC transporter permease [Gemmataceae bacterium]
MDTTTTTKITSTLTRTELVAPPERGPNAVYALIQTVVGLLVPLLLLRLVRPVVSPRRPDSRVAFLRVPVLLLLAGFWLFYLSAIAAMYALLGYPPFENPPKFNSIDIWAVGGAAFRAMMGVLQTQSGVLLLDWLFFRSFPNIPPDLRSLERALKRRIALERTIYSLIGTLFVIGFSLLPLASLLVALPLVSPNEAVLTDTVRPAPSRWVRLRRRVVAAFAGLVVLVALFAFGITVVGALPLPEGGQLATLGKKVLGSSLLDMAMPESFTEQPPKDLPQGEQWLTARELLDKRKTLEETARRTNQKADEKREAEARLAEVNKTIEERKPTSPRLQIMLDPQLAPWLARPIWTFLPSTLIQHWPFVLLVMYGTDLLLLLLIGRVPLAYNFRYLWVRKRDTALTALAFTVVVALVVVLLAFVNGMYKLNEGTGVPGNVMVLSDGATDELFSNLGYGDVSNAERVVVTEDDKGRPLSRPSPVARGVIGPDGRLSPLLPGAPKETPGAVYLASYETYLVMNQPVPVPEGEKPRRRFLQVRALKSAPVAAAVHNMDLYPGGRWFSDDGVDHETGGKYIPCVIGEGAAGTLGPDIGKRRLGVGDTFSLGDREWRVLGIMRTRGTTYGSEIWTSINNTVVKAAGKGDKYTTLVIRMEDNTDASGRAMAYHLQFRYDQAKLKAYAEPDYYKELTKTNEAFLTWIVVLAIVMAVGGVFGVMNTMFASIAARIKEVGVLRILG